jgi:hypothetical protein
VDQARLYRPQNAGFVVRIQCLHSHLNPKASQPRRLRGFLRGHRDFQTAGRAGRRPRDDLARWWG